jgi:hypothetical protein
MAKKTKKQNESPSNRPMRRVADGAIFLANSVAHQRMTEAVLLEIKMVSDPTGKIGGSIATDVEKLIGIRRDR